MVYMCKLTAVNPSTNPGLRRTLLSTALTFQGKHLLTAWFGNELLSLLPVLYSAHCLAYLQASLRDPLADQKTDPTWFHAASDVHKLSKITPLPTQNLLQMRSLLQRLLSPATTRVQQNLQRKALKSRLTTKLVDILSLYRSTPFSHIALL